jgi:hypothetical protein
MSSNKKKVTFQFNNDIEIIKHFYFSEIIISNEEINIFNDEKCSIKRKYELLNDSNNDIFLKSKKK